MVKQASSTLPLSPRVDARARVCVRVSVCALVANCVVIRPAISGKTRHLLGIARASDLAGGSTVVRCSDCKLLQFHFVQACVTLQPQPVPPLMMLKR